MRKTLSRDADISGTALHAGVAVKLVLSPAAAGTGVTFRSRGREIPARHELATETRLGTVLEMGGVRIAVVEHLMAAIVGAELDDININLEGPEPPILGGDALSYLEAMEGAGLREQPGRRKAIRLLRQVEVREGDASAALVPSSRRLFDYVLDYPGTALGRQSVSFEFSPARFKRDIAPARTFGFLKDLEGLRRQGLAKGASLENTLALDDKGVVNKERLRFADEFARHKILDAIGDLALAGAPLIARFEGVKSGHGLNNRLLRTLFADPANYEMVTLS